MRVTQYLLSGIFVIVGLTCYLLFLAERDSKMINHFNGTTIQGAR